MTTELIYLLATTALAASLWIPYIVGVNKHPIEADTFARPPALHIDVTYQPGSEAKHINVQMNQQKCNNNKHLAAHPPSPLPPGARSVPGARTHPQRL